MTEYEGSEWPVVPQTKSRIVSQRLSARRGWPEGGKPEEVPLSVELHYEGRSGGVREDSDL